MNLSPHFALGGTGYIDPFTVLVCPNMIRKLQEKLVGMDIWRNIMKLI